ncbi:MAG TPA: MBL fold metallo-hydrolase RNA specificity domain-containing protein, partial [Dehalococcoidia bacterium]|nr:MBL fold metallo-hydrolase RNA specificity domain-containing protein [Dehalococcoidia bacterium]
GRAILEGARTVRIHGEEVPVRARFLNVEGLSAHSDAAGLDRWLHSGPSLPRSIFLTHGEPAALAALSERLGGEGIKTIVPRLNEGFELDQAGVWHTRGLEYVAGES